MRTRTKARSNCTSTQPECEQALLLRHASADPSLLITTDSRALENAAARAVKADCDVAAEGPIVGCRQVAAGRPSECKAG